MSPRQDDHGAQAKPKSRFAPSAPFLGDAHDEVLGVFNGCEQAPIQITRYIF